LFTPEHNFLTFIHLALSRVQGLGIVLCFDSDIGEERVVVLPCFPLLSGLIMNLTLLLISLAGLGWAFSFGLGGSLCSLVLYNADVDAFAIGCNTALYYLGVAIASPFIPPLMARHNRLCLVLGMSLDALVTVVFPMCHGILAWHALRLLGGIGTAMSVLPMETLINRLAAPEHRSRDFGVYAFSVAVGLGLGATVGLPLYAVNELLPFVVGGAITLASVLLVLPVSPAGLAELLCVENQAPFAWRAGVVSFATAWGQGFLEGGTLSFLALHLLAIGYQESPAAGLLSALYLGVILAQLPLAIIADRLGRLRVLLLCQGALLGVLLLLLVLRGPVLLAIALFVAGACCGALYPLGLSLLAQRVETADLARANAYYLSFNCLGSLSGPVVIGVAVSWLGISAQFLVGAFVMLALLLLANAAREKKSGESPLAELRRAA
jgi:MFS family permease